MKTKKQIEDSILDLLEEENISANELYKRLGYEGNASKTFRNCINELISDNKIHYSTNNIQSSNNVLIKNKF